VRGQRSRERFITMALSAKRSFMSVIPTRRKPAVLIPCCGAKEPGKMFKDKAPAGYIPPCHRLLYLRFCSTASLAYKPSLTRIELYQHVRIPSKRVSKSFVASKDLVFPPSRDVIIVPIQLLCLFPNHRVSVISSGHPFVRGDF